MLKHDFGIVGEKKEVFLEDNLILYMMDSFEWIKTLSKLEENVEKYEVKFINGIHYEIPMIEEFVNDSDKDEIMSHGFYLDQGKNTKEALEEAKNYAKLIGKLV